MNTTNRHSGTIAGREVRRHDSAMAELTDVIKETGEFCDRATAFLERPKSGDLQFIVKEAEELILETLDALKRLKEEAVALGHGQQHLEIG